MHDIEQAINLLEQIVKEFGEDHYGPRYLFLDGQRCLVGEALSRLGVSDKALYDLGILDCEELWDGKLYPIELTFGAHAVYRAAQKAQDEGLNWGQAFDRAITAGARYISLFPERLLVPHLTGV